LTAGDTVLVLGGGGPLAQITVSMLRGLGYIPRPACNEKLVDMWKDQGVAAYVFGGAEPLPAAAGLLCASEAPVQPQVVCACVRRLAQSGPLSRVSLLSALPRGGGLTGLFGDSPVAKRDAAEAEVLEACTDAGVEWTVVRVGRLRGGGTGTGSVHCLPRAFYDSFAEDGLLGPTAGMEEEIFDLQRRGLRLGDVDGGPLGLDVPTAGRVLAATALSSSLGLAEAAGKRLGVASEVAEKGPSEDEWVSAFRAQG